MKNVPRWFCLTVTLLFSLDLAFADDFKTEQQILDELTTQSYGKTRGLLGSSKGLSPEPKRTQLTVPFEFDSAWLTTEAVRQLDALAGALTNRQLNGISFQVIGHTDAQGSHEYNHRLSEKRAQTVVKYLVAQHGLDLNNLSSKGMGENQLLFPDQPENGDNRRVEVVNLEQ